MKVKKYTTWGKAKVNLTEDEMLGGDFKIDNAFINAQSISRNIAKNMCLKNINETCGE
jgi:hypothetical protein